MQSRVYRGSQKLFLSGFSAILLFLSAQALAAERFYLTTPGLSLSYTHLFYGHEHGFFSREGLDLQILVVRGQIGVSSLMAGEVDVTTHAGSGFAAALRGLPLKIISVTRDQPFFDLIVAPSIASPHDLKGKSIAVGSLEGAAAVMTRRVLQTKGLDPQKDVVIVSMGTTALRYQSLISRTVAGTILTPPFTYLAVDQGFHVFGRARDYMRYLQTGVVTTDAKIKQKRRQLVGFLRAWNRALKFYQKNPETMVPYIRQKFGVKEAALAKRMYDDDRQNLLLNGQVSPEVAREILETGREALNLKEPVSAEKIFDFSLTSEASK